MKQLILFIAVLVLAIPSVTAQSRGCKKQLRKALTTHFSTAQSIEEWRNAAAAFEPIADKYDKEWLPLYYYALAKVNASGQTKNGAAIDIELDEAQIALDKAVKLAPNESELYVLQANLYFARIAVNYYARGLQMVSAAHGELTKAKALNPENPRVYYLLAMSAFNTPPQFGGGKDKALPLFQKAKEKFDTFKPANRYSPNWGKGDVPAMITKCKA